jgi:hypothetical protein
MLYKLQVTQYHVYVVTYIKHVSKHKIYAGTNHSKHNSLGDR